MNSNDKASFIFILILLFLGGLLFGIPGLLIIKKELEKKKKCTVKTTGKVVGNHEQTNTDGHYTYYPIIKYKAGNDELTSRSYLGRATPYEIGEPIIVYYNPQKRSMYTIEGQSGEKLGWVFLIAGIGLAAIAIYMIISVCF